MKNFEAACVQSPLGGVVTPEYLDAVLASAGRPELVVLPEMCTVPYFPLESGSMDAASPVAVDGPLAAAYGRLAQKYQCHLLMGLYVEDEGARWNAAVLLDPEGKLMTGRSSRGRKTTLFRKVHLCDVQMDSASFCESAYFAAGDEYVVWDTRLAAISTLICYDRHFPEAWVALRKMGAELVGVCTTSPVSTEPSFVAEMQAMALQQSVFVAMANRVGTEELRTSGTRTEFLGASCIVNPAGVILALASPRQPEAVITAHLNGDDLSRVRRQNKFHESRQPHTYLHSSSPVSNPLGGS